MNRKFKLASLGASMVLSLGVMLTGVFAATSHDVTISNNVSFTASKNVDATISYSVVGSTSDVTDQTLWTSSDSDTDKDTGTYAFSSSAVANDTITITFTIENLSTDYDLYVNITNPTNTSTDGLISMVAGSFDSNTLVSKGGSNTATYTITYTLTDISEDAEAGFNNLKISLNVNETN